MTDVATAERQRTATRPASESEVWEDDLLRSLHTRHATPLLRFVLRLTGGDRYWAEDVVQETLLRAWRNTDQLATSDSDTGPWPWLCLVARRVVIDDLRKRQVRPPEVGDELLQYRAIADEIGPMLESVVISEALNAISASHRETLVLIYYHGHTIPEIASILGLPLGTAKSRVYYGLRALRLALQERGVAA
jgi:RNA polymerase sigma-70 factor (ECF subfamily)